MNYERTEFYIKFKEWTAFDKTIVFKDHNIVIGKGSKIGKGTMIMRNVVIKEDVWVKDDCIIGNNSLIRKNAHLEDNVKVGFSTVIEPNTKIGERTSIHGLCVISEFSEIGKNCFIAPLFNNPADKTAGNTILFPEKFKDKYKPYPASIGDNVRIGSSVKLKPGIHIGDNAFIWMGSLVTKDVPDGEMWGGSPATKREKTKDDNGNKTLANPLADPEIQEDTIYGGG